MSEMTKLRQSYAAASATKSELERAARKLLDFGNCPLILVYARSGGPSTENTFTCQFNSGIPGDSPDCPSYGRMQGCRLLPLLYQRKDIARFLALRNFQTNLALYEKRVNGQSGWWSGPGINENLSDRSG